jgi:hypothetical protein
VSAQPGQLRLATVPCADCGALTTVMFSATLGRSLCDRCDRRAGREWERELVERMGAER